MSLCCQHMALDVFVMPLWQFKSGLSTSPIETALGIRPMTISLADEIPTARPRPPWYLRVLARVGIITFIEPPPEPSPTERYEKATGEVADLKATLTQRCGHPVDWQDDGKQVYGEQFHGRDLLRTFASWCDHRDVLPEFPKLVPYPEKHPVWDLPAPERRRFPVLTTHSMYTGYFLPTPFEGVHEVEPFKAMGHWDMHHDVASTQAVVGELIELQMLINELEQAGGSSEHLEYVGYTREWVGVLRKICDLSLEHGLPVIWYG